MLIGDERNSWLVGTFQGLPVLDSMKRAGYSRHILF